LFLSVTGDSSAYRLKVGLQTLTKQSGSPAGNLASGCRLVKAQPDRRDFHARRGI